MLTRKVIQMADDNSSRSALRERISRGEAEPISDVERDLAKLIRADINKKYGRPSPVPQKKRRWRLFS